jgi:hypothetical protein
VAYNGEIHLIFSLTRKSTMDNTVGSLTQLQKSIIIGSLLGDGYLRIVEGRKDALLEMNHSYSQKEYVDWKYKMLQSICASSPKSRKGNGTRIAYRFTTRQHSELTQIFTLFYTDKVKRIPDGLVLDPIMLAVWFMDDGSRCRAQDVYLNTQQFALEDQQNCLAMLSQMGIDASLNKDKEYKRVRVKTSSIPTLFRIISPYIIPSMAYKIGL